MSDFTAIIGGSGIGDLLGESMEAVEVVDIDTPFGKPSGQILSGKIRENNVLFLNRHGKGHKFGPSDIPFTANIYALKKAGAKTVIATGAVGSLRENIHPGQLVIVDQFIDKTFKRQNSFFSGVGAVHCEFSHPCCPRVKDKLLNAGKSLRIDIHDGGVYVCMEGPQFSTKAESQMHRSWGGDVIGMTAMPEAKLCREAQMCYSLIAMPSDYDCWKPVEEGKGGLSLLEEIIGNLNKCSENAISLILEAMKKENGFCDENCGCRKSLEFAVWTDKSFLDKNKMRDLEVLFK